MNSCYLFDKRQTASTILWCFLTGLSLPVLLIYVQVSAIGTDGMPAALVDGLADKPYQLRALAPLIVRWLAPWLPGALVQTAAANPALGPTIDQLAPGRPAVGLAALGVMYASLLAALAALIKLAADLDYNHLQQWIGALGLLSGLVLLFAPAAYLYDLPTLALFSWCLVWIHRRKYEAYLITFALANLSKETALLLIPVYWIGTDHGEYSRYRVFEQLAVFLISRAALLFHYRTNAGGPVEWHFQDMAHWITLPNLWPFFGLLISMVILMLWGWVHKPLFLRQALLVTLPILAGLYVFFGYPGEIRVFLEIAPVMLLLMFRRRVTHGRKPTVRDAVYTGIFGTYPDCGSGNAAGKG